MCNLSQVRNFSQLMISKNLSPSQLALKKKNDARAFALLRVIAATQVVPSPDLTRYPTLSKYLSERKNK